MEFCGDRAALTAPSSPANPESVKGEGLIPLKWRRFRRLTPQGMGGVASGRLQLRSGEPFVSPM
jgi:hypothetical protein